MHSHTGRRTPFGVDDSTLSLHLLRGALLQVYTHKTAKAIEYMVVDALIEADVVQNGRISKAIWSPEDFAVLDDTVLREIERSRDQAMAKAKALVKRIRTRNLYKFVNEFTVPGQYVDPGGKWDTITPAAIVACQVSAWRGCLSAWRPSDLRRAPAPWPYCASSGPPPPQKHDGTVPGGLREEDIIVQNQKLDFAMNGRAENELPAPSIPPPCVSVQLEPVSR